MRHHPRDRLPHDLGLVVVPLDADEDLAQRPGLDDVVHELDGEPPAEVDHFSGRARVLGEGGVEGAKAEAVLEVAYRVHERRVAFLNGHCECANCYKGNSIDLEFGNFWCSCLEGHFQIVRLYICFANS